MSSCYCEFLTDTGTTFRAVEASMTLTRGVSPSICTMQVGEYDCTGIAAKQVDGTWIQGANGTLSFSDGVNGSVVFYGCRVMDFTIEKEANEYRSTMRIADRRWKWGGLMYTYQYWNFRDMQGTVVGTEDWDIATAEQIGTSLLKYHLNEGTYQVMLPGDADNPASKPFFNWEKVNPASCLQELCEFYDASVTLTPNTDMIRIFADGSYNDDPASAKLYQREELKYLGEPIPQYYVIYGGMRRMEVDMPLTPVVLDVDGSLKGYGFHDSNGSRIYTNAGTRDCSWLPKHLPWRNDSLDGLAARFPGSTAEAIATRAAVKDCAAKSLYRWYRLPESVTLYSEGDEGTDVVNAPALWRQTKLETNSLEQVDADTIRYGKAMLYGTGFFKQEGYDSNVRTSGLTGVYKGQFSLDMSSGVVRLSEQVASLAGSLSAPGTLWLRAVVEDQVSAYVGTSDLMNGSDTSIEYGYCVNEVHEDLVYEYGVNGSNNGTVLYASDRLARGQSYVDVIAEQYNRRLASNVGITTTYPGIHAFACDGLYQQVTWTLGWNKPPVTVVSRDTDHNIRAAADLERQAVWQGKLVREQKNRAAKMVNEQFKTSEDSADFD